MDITQVLSRVAEMFDEVSKQIPGNNALPPQFIEWDSEAIILLPGEIQGKKVNSWAINATSTQTFTVAHLPSNQILPAQQNDIGDWVVVGAVSPGQVFVSANIQATTKFRAQTPVNSAARYWSCSPKE